MMQPNAILTLLTIAARFTTSSATNLSWGTFLGADWKVGEENLRANLAASIKNLQQICAKDVESVCLPSGDYADTFGHATTDWTDHSTRHMYNHFDEVPIGYGETADACLHNEYAEAETGGGKHLTPKCFQWLETTEARFENLIKREKGNDKREWFIRFATIIAALLSVGTGVIYGIFKSEQNESVSLGFGSEDDRVITVFIAACAIPTLIILWASPMLMAIMSVSFFIGRFSQLFIMSKNENQYSSVSTNSGLVFAAIPVQLD